MMVIEMAFAFRVIEESAKSCVVWACGSLCPDLTTCFTFSTFLVHFLLASVLFSNKPGWKAVPLPPNVTGANKP